MKKHALIPGIATLAVCALALTTLGSAKKPVEKPFKCQTVNTWVIDLASMDIETGIAPVTLHVDGEATHLGRITADGSGLWNVYAGWYVSASGVGTAANGDQISMKIPGATYVLEFTGGTGRFENVSGGFSPITIISVTPELSEDGSTLTITISAKGEGSITY